MRNQKACGKMVRFELVRTLETAREVSDLIDDTWKHYRRPHRPSDILSSPSLHWYVAELDGEVVGAGFVRKEGRCAELGGWMVKKPYRGKRFGSLIAKFGMRLARELGAEEVYVEAVTAHTISQRICERVLELETLGYIPLAVEDAPRESPLDWMSFVVYGNYKPWKTLPALAKGLAGRLGFEVDEIPSDRRDGGKRRPPADVDRKLARSVVDAEAAEREGLIPVAFFPTGILYVNLERLEKNTLESLVKKEALTPKGRVARDFVLERVRELAHEIYEE